MFVTKRKLNKKLDLLLQRQTMMMEILLSTHLTYEGVKKVEKKWNKLWYKIMEGKKNDFTYSLCWEE